MISPIGHGPRFARQYPATTLCAARTLGESHVGQTSPNLSVALAAALPLFTKICASSRSDVGAVGSDAAARPAMGVSPSATLLPLLPPSTQPSHNLLHNLSVALAAALPLVTTTSALSSYATSPRRALKLLLGGEKLKHLSGGHFHVSALSFQLACACSFLVCGVVVVCAGCGRADGKGVVYSCFGPVRILGHALTRYVNSARAVC